MVRACSCSIWFCSFLFSRLSQFVVWVCWHVKNSQPHAFLSLIRVNVVTQETSFHFAHVIYCFECSQFSVDGRQNEMKNAQSIRLNHLRRATSSTNEWAPAFMCHSHISIERQHNYNHGNGIVDGAVAVVPVSVVGGGCCQTARRRIVI